MEVVSLYDLTGIACLPWAEAGFECYCYDILHPLDGDDTARGIHKRHADLHDPSVLDQIIQRHRGKAVFLSAFPVCTDLACSGARWWAGKGTRNPNFQIEAASYAQGCERVAVALGTPYYVENPVGKLSTLWRRPDHTFHPCDFGGYLTEAQQEHPQYPSHIPNGDAYTKKTCLWVGNHFRLPSRQPVSPIVLVCNGKKYAPQALKLGGKSALTKHIRSATPRGFARAVFEANRP